MPRKNKITTDKHARKYQRDRAKKLEHATSDWEPLQTTPPRYLSKTAKAVYRHLIPVLQQSKIIKEPDHAVVEALCIQIEMLRRSYGEIQKHGIQEAIYHTPISPTGEMGKPEFAGFKKNPAVNTLSDATQKIKQLSSELGLTPQSRATLLNLTKADDEGDPMEQIAAMLNGDPKEDKQ